MWNSREEHTRYWPRVSLNVVLTENSDLVNVNQLDYTELWSSLFGYVPPLLDKFLLFKKIGPFFYFRLFYTVDRI